MTTNKDLPVSGYAIAAIYSTNQQLKAVSPDNLLPEEQVTVGWNWRWVERRVVEVRVTVTVDASQSRPYLLSADVIGRFRQVADSPSLDIQEFVSLQAIAILLPYVRQYLSALSSNTLGGSYYLPSLNVAELRKAFKFADSTGANQEPPGAAITPARRTKQAKKRAPQGT